MSRLSAEPPWAPLRVLVVDDNEDTADATAVLFGSLGTDVRVAYQGSDALDILENFTPHLALVDWSMPGMGGLELARHLRQRCASSIYIVGISGYHIERDEHAGVIDEVLCKPASTKKLERICGVVWARL